MKVELCLVRYIRQSQARQSAWVLTYFSPTAWTLGCGVRTGSTTAWIHLRTPPYANLTISANPRNKLVLRDGGFLFDIHVGWAYTGAGQYRGWLSRGDLYYTCLNKTLELVINIHIHIKCLKLYLNPREN